jgi:hypothetical protein
MHLYNYIWVVILVPRLNLAFLLPKLSCDIHKVLVCLCSCGFDNPRKTLMWKLLQFTSVRLRIILLGSRTTNRVPPPSRTSCLDVDPSLGWATSLNPLPGWFPVDVGPIGEDDVKVRPSMSYRRSRHHRCLSRGDCAPTLTPCWSHGLTGPFQPLGQAGAVRPWAKWGPTLLTN